MSNATFNPIIVGFAIVTLALGQTASAGAGIWTGSGPDGGETNAIVASATTANRAFAATSSGVYRTDDKGLSWNSQSTGLPNIFVTELVLAGGIPERLLAVSAGKPYITQDAGLNWLERSTGLPATVRIVHMAVDPVDASRLYASTSEHGLWGTSDGGLSWAQLGMGVLPLNLWAVAVNPFDSNEVLVGAGAFDGSIDQIWHSDNGGATWAAATGLPTGSQAGISAFAYVSNSEIYAGNRFGELFTSSTGSAWAMTASNPQVGAVNALDTTSGIAGTVVVGGDSGAQITLNGGITFAAYDNGITSDGANVNGVRAIDHFTDGTQIAGSDFGGVFIYNTALSTWEPHNSGLWATNIRALAINPDHSDWVYAGYGDAFRTPSASFYRSSDGGITWTASNTGLRSTSLRAIVADPNTSSVAANTVLYAAGVSAPLSYPSYLVDGVCAIFKSTDNGATWATSSTGIPTTGGIPDSCLSLTQRSIVVDTNSATVTGGASQTLYLGGSGRISYDAMGTATIEAHRIYKSTNAGALWAPADSGLGVPPYDPGTTQQAQSIVIPLVLDQNNPSVLYAGTLLRFDETRPTPIVDNGVFKSVNGGATWALASTGIPRQGAGASDPHLNVFALAIAPSNSNRLYAALELPGGAGTVYRSDDAGASWVPAGAGILPTADIRALLVDPSNDDIAYAGTAGVNWNPGGVYRTEDGGVSWQSISAGLDRDVVLALALDDSGSNPKLVAGARGGVSQIELLPDDDADAADDATELAAPNVGDGNNDGLLDVDQADVVSLPINADSVSSPYLTIEVTPILGGCEQISNTQTLSTGTLPANNDFFATGPQLRFELGDCQHAQIDVHWTAGQFDATFELRHYGPTTPGDERTVGWHPGVDAGQTISPQHFVFELIDGQPGDTRPLTNSIAFQGAIVEVDLLFGSGFE